MLSKRAKNIFRSILLVFLGCFLGLLILELSLRGFGYVLANWNKFTYLKTKQPDELRILTLGESMTNSGANPYPTQLQEILSRNPKIRTKVNVINGGVPGSSSQEIVKNLESYLDQYNPDIVVVMTGINNDGIVDYEQWANIQKEGKFSNIKTIKLLRYLFQNIKINISLTINSKIISYAYSEESNVDDILKIIYNKTITGFEDQTIELIPNNQYIELTPYEENLYNELENSNKKDQIYIDLCNYYSGKGQRTKAVEYALKAVSINPYNSDAYHKLSNIQELSPKQRERLALKAIETNSENVYAYLALAEIYRASGETEKRIEIYKKGISIVPNSLNLLLEIGKMNYSLGNYKEAEIYFLEALKYIENDISIKPNLYHLLAKIYQKQNRTEEANKILALAVQSNDVLENNLPIIAEILKNRGIKLIAMQYPLRDINILKNILNDYDVSYVDNKMSFEEAVKNEGVEKIFLDLFAGDFGHCTPEGNRIMANNVAKVILEEYKLE